jgi:muconolactone delta-isomerase
MEYLVTMTTRVPDGTRSKPSPTSAPRETTARSRELTAEAPLRLWRPPLQPGDNTLGHFAAADDASWKGPRIDPLRVWRTDRPSLSPHPNDPVPPPPPGPPEFLTTFTLTIPEGTPARVVDDTDAREADSARELARQGHLLRLWRLPPGGPGALGLWRARDAAEMQAILESLPLWSWMIVQTTPLASPSDPALAGLERNNAAPLGGLARR